MSKEKSEIVSVFIAWLFIAAMVAIFIDGYLSYKKTHKKLDAMYRECLGEVPEK